MKDLKRLSYERSWCQKGVHFYKQQEFQIIKELSKSNSVKFLCEIMDVNRSSYYKWLNRIDNPSIKMIQREKDINLIKEIHHKHLSHGYRWINAYAHSHKNVNWTDKHVHLCCKYAGIISSRKHYKYVKPGEEKIKYKNLVNCLWKYLSRPLEVVVSDMIAFYVKGKYYELTFYFDALPSKY